MNVGRGVVRSDHHQLPPELGLEWGEALSWSPKAAQEGTEQQGGSSGMYIHPGEEVGIKIGCSVLARDWCWSRSSSCEPQVVFWKQAPNSSSARARGCPHCQSSAKARGALLCPLVLLQSPPGDISGGLEAVKFKHRELNPLAS